MHNFGGKIGKQKKSLHWMAWHKLANGEAMGGLGFKEIVFLQSCFACKNWRLINDPDSLLGQILRAKYFPNSTFWRHPVGEVRPGGGKVYCKDG